MFRNSENQMTFNIEWGMSRCWRCKGEGKIFHFETQYNTQSSNHNTSDNPRTCPVCGGEGIVPNR